MCKRFKNSGPPLRVAGNMNSVDTSIRHGQFRACLWIKMLRVCPFGVLCNPRQPPLQTRFFLVKALLFLYNGGIVNHGMVSVQFVCNFMAVGVIHLSINSPIFFNCFQRSNSIFKIWIKSNSFIRNGSKFLSKNRNNFEVRKINEN